MGALNFPNPHVAFAQELETLVAKYGRVLNDNQVITTLEQALSRAWDFAGEPQPASLFEHAPELLSIARRWIALEHGGWHVERHAREQDELLSATAAALAKAEGRS